MNPNPSDRQWLVLYQVDEGHVWWDGTDDWWSRGLTRNAKVTAAVRRLWQLGLLSFAKPLTEGDKPMVTDEGIIVLTQRSVYDVLEKTRGLDTE